MISNIKIIETKILSDNWYRLNKVTYQYNKPDGSSVTQSREAYDRGNGAAILLYNPDQQTVILTKQFRLPTYLNANPTGMLVEVCAGLLDEEDAKACIIRETLEETGYQITDATKIFEAYMSPGAVTEIIHFFIAPYTPQMKVALGGGLASEEENIEVIELPFDHAYQMIATGEIKDAKTIMLLQYLRLNAWLAGEEG